MEMIKKELKRISSPTGLWLIGKRGKFWITFPGDTKDYILQTGEAIWCPPKQELLIEALEAGSLCTENTDHPLQFKTTYKPIAC